MSADTPLVNNITLTPVLEWIIALDKLNDTLRTQALREGNRVIALQNEVARLTSVLHEIHTWASDHVDISSTGGPNLAMRITMLIDNTLRESL